MRTLYILATMLLASGSAWSNVIINGTRVIYPENTKETVVQLINNGDDPSLVQAWIDDGDINSTPETAKVPFLLTPPVVKVNGHNGQQLRIKKLPASLPGDRESVFYLNVLDIPPKPENMQSLNTMQLAIKSRIKVFYRPTALKGTLEQAINQLRLNADARGFTIINNSPFNITIANIEGSGESKLLENSLMVAPFSQDTAISKKSVRKGQSYRVMYVDDAGAYQTKALITE